MLQCIKEDGDLVTAIEILLLWQIKMLWSHLLQVIIITQSIPLSTVLNRPLNAHLENRGKKFIISAIF